MNTAAIYSTIKSTVQHFLPGARVVLFGSHARGVHDRHSDYDLLIITAKTFTSNEKIRWSTRLDRAIVEAIKAPVDILINSNEEIQKKQSLPGHIIRSVMREGITL